LKIQQAKMLVSKEKQIKNCMKKKEKEQFNKIDDLTLFKSLFFSKQINRLFPENKQLLMNQLFLN